MHCSASRRPDMFFGLTLPALLPRGAEPRPPVERCPICWDTAQEFLEVHWYLCGRGEIMREKSKKVCHLATGQVVCPLVVNARYMGCPKMEVGAFGMQVGHVHAMN